MKINYSAYKAFRVTDNNELSDSYATYEVGNGYTHDNTDIPFSRSLSDAARDAFYDNIENPMSGELVFCKIDVLGDVETRYQNDIIKDRPHTNSIRILERLDPNEAARLLNQERKDSGMPQLELFTERPVTYWKSVDYDEHGNRIVRDIPVR